jgi:hypothetical protein
VNRLSGALTARNELHGKQYSVLASAGILLIGPVVVDRGCPLPSPIPSVNPLKKLMQKLFIANFPFPIVLRISALITAELEHNQSSVNLWQKSIVADVLRRTLRRTAS